MIETVPSPEKNLSQNDALLLANEYFRSTRMHNLYRFCVEDQGVLDEKTGNWKFDLTAVPAGIGLPHYGQAEEEFVAQFNAKVGCVVVMKDRQVISQPPIQELDNDLQVRKNHYSECLVLRGMMHGMAQRMS
ncbi:hypothetical protein A3D88_01875 [Candidatus Peribacteria bacterium RIFCSPHIGHO2_02_FULL_52_16]|nr:MAG: hypothetical protein A2706_05070 [Candidatus Peribacteria bacterium RIFCSPHIGHO2_01_FULL_51_35]OGJ61136.1 MAG: hypothetical protein A3D88_01875 [Candidatus Peribacteria bacterium RIFCSPHIGHO2_02_FULL_52_16]